MLSKVEKEYLSLITLKPMNKIKKILITIVIGIFLLTGISYAQIGGGISPPSFWKLVGNDVKLVRDTWDLVVGNIEIGGVGVGDLDLGDNSLTGVDTITFTDATGTIATIENQNLLDKSATEIISGEWTFSAATNLATATIAYIDITGGVAVFSDVTTTNFSCTNCLNATEIEDIYLLYTGGTVTGALTVSGISALTTTTITGSIDISGDFKMGGLVMDVYKSAYAFGHTATTTAVSGAGNWMEIHFDEEVGIIDNITHSTSSDPENFTIVDTGTYQISYSIGFIDTSASPSAIINTRITIDDVELEGSLFQKDTTKQNAVGTIHHSVLAELTVGEVIVIEFTSDETTVSLAPSTTYGDHHDSASILIKRIK